MKKKEKFVGRRLLLMGSKAFRKTKLPKNVAEKLDEAMTRKMTIIVGEAPGANRLFQDYLKSKEYKKVIVGHAKSMRYNAGDWKTVQYGMNVSERERHMIEDCDSAVIIWADRSSVIAENLELLKRYEKPTFLFEFSNKSGKEKAGWLDPERTYDPFFDWKEYQRRKKREKGC
jgi:hypothetical protein